jgi:hypothetical protein
MTNLQIKNKGLFNDAVMDGNRRGPGRVGGAGRSISMIIETRTGPSTRTRTRMNAITVSGFMMQVYTPMSLGYVLRMIARR